MEEFYRAMGIQPIYVSGCEFENLYRLGLEYGSDICEHVEETDFKCKDCKLSEISEIIYPPITDGMYLDFLREVLNKGDFSESIFETTADLKKQILSDMITFITDEQDKKRIRKYIYHNTSFEGINPWKRSVELIYE